MNSTRPICALEKKAHLKEHRIGNLKPRELVQRRLGEKDLVAVFGIAFPQEAHREARVELIKAALNCLLSAPTLQAYAALVACYNCSGLIKISANCANQ